jgi:hypothetical protein
MFFIVDLATIFENNILAFQLTPAKLLGDDQTINNGAANTSFLLITTNTLMLLTRFHPYNGAICIAAPLYWIVLVEPH